MQSLPPLKHLMPPFSASSSKPAAKNKGTSQRHATENVAGGGSQEGQCREAKNNKRRNNKVRPTPKVNTAPEFNKRTHPFEGGGVGGSRRAGQCREGQKLLGVQEDWGTDWGCYHHAKSERRPLLCVCSVPTLAEGCLREKDS